MLVIIFVNNKLNYEVVLMENIRARVGRVRKDSKYLELDIDLEMLDMRWLIEAIDGML